jgi:tape measure domain-containing protein
MPGDNMSENVGTIEYTVKADTAALLTAGRSVGSINSDMQRSFDRTDASVSTLTSSFGKLSAVATGVMGALSANEVLKYADAWTTLNNKLVNSVGANEQLIEVTNRVFDISQQTRTSVEATATLYGRLERATRKYNLSAEQMSQLTTTINKGLVVSGATTEEASSATVQLSQALASGVLRGEEFNSITENGSRLAQALADSLGVDVGQLRAMAAAGQLTTKVVVDGLLKQGNQIGAEFAKTTQTIGQAFTVATNNITKFVGESSTVQSTVAGISTAVVTVSENLDTLSNVFVALAAVMGSRFVGALAASTVAMTKNAIASAAQAKAATESARASELDAASKLRAAQADKGAAISALNLAQAQLNVIKQTNAESTAEVRLAQAQAESTRTSIALLESEKALEVQRLKAQITDKGRIATATRMAELQQASAALTTRLATQEAAAEAAKAAAISTAEKNVSAARLAAADATGAATLANGRYIASQEAVVVASRASSVAVTALKGAMSLLGGPAGVVMIAAVAMYSWYQSAQQAKEEAISLADNVDSLTESYTKLNHAQLEGTQARLEESVLAQKDAITDLQGTVEDTARVMEIYKKVLDNTSQDSPTYTRAQQNYEQAVRDNKVAVADLDTAQGKLAKTGGLLEKVNERLAGGLDILSQKAQQLKADLTAISQTPVESRSAKGDDLLKDLQQESELLKITDKRQRAIAASRQQALEKGVEEGSAQIKQIEAQAGALYDLQQAEKAASSSSKASGAAATKQATQQAVITQKLEQMRQKSEVSAESTKELSREQAILTAQQSLGNAATEQQIKLAGEYAAKTWDATYAVKARQEAEQGQKFAKQEIAQTQSTADPITGEVADPTAAIDLQEQQKLATVAKYQALDVQNTQLYEDTKTAIQARASAEREKILLDESNKQAMQTSQLIGIAASSFDSLASVIAASGGKTSAAYKAIFAISKGFAIAQASLNMMTAVSNALALPFPANIPAMASAAAAGAQIASSISGMSYSGGRRYGGTTSSGNMYRVNESGEPEMFQSSGGKQYMMPTTSGKVVPASDVGGGGSSSPVNVVINNMANGTTVENQGYNPDTKTITLAVKEVARQLRTRTGDVSRALGEGWNTTGKSQ